MAIDLFHTEESISYLLLDFYFTYLFIVGMQYLKFQTFYFQSLIDLCINFLKDYNKNI